MFSKNYLKKIDWLLVIVPIVAVIILSAILIDYPSESHVFLQNCRNFLTSKLMYYYLIVGLVFLLSTLFLGFTKWGKIRLGNATDKPEYSTLKWGMMIFTSTMSADIIFYSLCEWMMYASEPIVKQAPDSLNLSLTYSLFHWGPIAWSFYIMLAVAFGYMIYVTKNNKQKFSEACRPLFGKLIDGWIGKLIDLIAIFSLIAATATTFSMSMPLLTAAVKTMTGFGNIKLLSIGLIILVVAIYLIASVIGMKAISRLSIVAFSFLGLLLLFVLCTSGSASFIMGSSAKAFGNLIVKFIPMATTVRDTHFTQNWTVYYWAYWMVWCVATPFFIGSISKGRTIRNVIFGGYFWGLLGTYLSFFILSNFGISRQISGVINAVKLINSGDSYASIIVRLMETLPHYQVGLILLILAMIGLYSTVFDSITMVISKYSYRSLALSEEPSRLMRGFWAVVFVLLPLALIWTGTSFTNVQSVAIIAAFPTGIVMLLIVVSFWWEIGMKEYKGYIPLIVMMIALIINFIFFIMSFNQKSKSNFGDSATWFASFITVGTIVIAYWQLVATKKQAEPEIVVAEGSKRITLPYEDIDSNNYREEDKELKFQIANIGNGSAKNMRIKIDNRNYWEEKLNNINITDYDIDDTYIYVGLKSEEKSIHARALGWYWLEVKNYLNSKDSTNIYLPVFYLCLLRNYTYDCFNSIKRLENNNDYDQWKNKLFKLVKKFPILHCRVQYESINGNIKDNSFSIQPYAEVIDINGTKEIYFEFTIRNM